MNIHFKGIKQIYNMNKSISKKMRPVFNTLEKTSFFDQKLKKSTTHIRSYISRTT